MVPVHAHDAADAGCIAAAIFLCLVQLVGVELPNAGMFFQLRTGLQSRSARYAFMPHTLAHVAGCTELNVQMPVVVECDGLGDVLGAVYVVFIIVFHHELDR